MTWDNFWPVILALALHLTLCVVGPQRFRPGIALLWVTSLYYSLFGPIYWLRSQDGQFLGVNWSDQIPRAADYIAWSALAFAASLCVFGAVFSTSSKASATGIGPPAFPDRRATTLGWGRSILAWQVVFGLGTVSCVIVLLQVLGSGAAGDDTRLNLVAYQFSDLTIPAIVFIIGARGLDRVTVPLLLLFTLYASIIGFRYKLALVYFPMAVMYIFPVSGKRTMSLWKSSTVLALVVAGFAVLTLTRSKFSGVDLTALSTASGEDLFYGLFAETNTIFGLISVLRESIDFGSYVHWDPVRDAFLELVPRSLLPNRVTGAYLQTSLERLIAEEALQSGTAFPYLGELLLMGGVPALAVGTVILTGIYGGFAHLIGSLKGARSRLADAGHGLLAAYFGYYYFSRGYLPQTLKALLFVVVPFIIIVRCVPRERGTVASGVGAADDLDDGHLEFLPARPTSSGRS